VAWVTPTSAIRVQLGGDYDALVKADGAIGYWRLGDAVGSLTATDASGNGHTGTVVGGVTFGQATPQPDTNGGALFDGSTGKITQSDSAFNLTRGPLSVEAWVKRGAGSSDAGIAGVGYANGYQLNWHAGATLYFYIGGGGNSANFNFSDGTIWHHMVGTWDGTTATNGIKLYLDGVLVAQGTAAVTTLSASGFKIGQNTTYFAGALDDVAVYPVALTAAQVAAHYLAGQWTDLSKDLTGDPIVLDYGVRDTNPATRIAGTGTLTFGLRNDVKNSGGVLGWYSPFNANRRPGWQHGNRVQYALTYGSAGTVYWCGRLRGIDAAPGQWEARTVTCTALDWLDDAARQNMTVGISANVRGDQAASALIAIVPKSPLRTAIGVGSDTYVYAFDNLWVTSTVFAGLADLARSELGYIGQRRDAVVGQTVFYENRHARVSNSALRVTVDGLMTGLDILPNAAEIYTRFRVTDYPRTIVPRASLSGPVASLGISSGRAALLPGQSIAITLNYTDPANRGSFIGATNIVPPAATTDYTANTAPDGSGLDCTGSLSVTLTAWASAAKLLVTLGGAQAAYITKLQVRGDAVFALNPAIGESAASAFQALYGDNLADVDMPYQGDPAFASNAAAYLSHVYTRTSPTPQIKTLKFCANRSDAFMVAAVLGDISDRVAVGEIVSGVTTDRIYYINAVKLTLSERGRLDCEWQLVPGDGNHYWVLGTASASELGSTSILAL